MKVLSAEFVTSAAAGGSTSGIPRDALAQIAFAGRSNVGKSTLLNALVRRKIARTSGAPGKTRLANIFRVDVDGGPGGPGHWAIYFVDLPGYGYARGGGDSADELRAVAERYLGSGQRQQPERGDGVKPRGARPPSESERGWGPASSEESRPPAESIRLVVLLLVDSRHPGLESDRRAHEWLSGIAGPPQVVATKIDKLSRAERARNLRELERFFGTAALPVSAASGEGLDELWTLIARMGRNNASNADARSGRTGPSGTETAPGARGADAPTSTGGGRRVTATKPGRR